MILETLKDVSCENKQNTKHRQSGITYKYIDCNLL